MVVKQYIFLVLLFSSLSTYCMQQEGKNDDTSQINEKIKPLFNRVREKLAFIKDLETLKCIRFENNKYEWIGEGISNLSEKDYENIKNKNFVYTPCYSQEKIGSRYEYIGGIMIGTRDEKHLCEIALGRIQLQLIDKPNM